MTKMAGGGRVERLPIGYVRRKDQKVGFKIALDPERAPIIRKVFTKVADGKWTVQWAYLWLKYESAFFTRGGGSLSMSGVERMLRNRSYCQRGMRGQAPLVTKDVFGRASARAVGAKRHP